MSSLNPAIKAYRLDWARISSIGTSLLLVTQMIPLLLVLLLRDAPFATEICASAVVMNALMAVINVFNYEQTGHHRLMNGLVPVNRRHQVTGRYLIVLGNSLVAALMILVCAVLGDLLAATAPDPERIAMLVVAGVGLVWLGSAILLPLLYREGIAVLAAMGVLFGLFFLFVIVLNVVQRSGSGFAGITSAAGWLAEHPAALALLLAICGVVLRLSYRMALRVYTSDSTARSTGRESPGSSIAMQASKRADEQDRHDIRSASRSYAASRGRQAMQGWRVAMKSTRFDASRIMGNTTWVGVAAVLLPLTFIFPASLMGDGDRALMLVAAISMFYWFMTLAGPPALDGMGEHGAMRGLIPVSRTHQVIGRYGFMLMIAVFCAVTALWSFVVGTGVLGLEASFSAQTYTFGAGCVFLVFSAVVIPLYYAVDSAKATQIMVLMFVVLTALPVVLVRYAPDITYRVIRWIMLRVSDHAWLVPSSVAVLTVAVVLSSLAISLRVWRRREL